MKIKVDGFFFTCLMTELRPLLTGSRVEDVFEDPDRNLVLQLRAPGTTHNLVVAVGRPPHCLYITAGPVEKQISPFSQLLKNKLAGLFCIRLLSPPFERWGTLEFAARPDSGQEMYQLHFELMGRLNDLTLCQANIILTSTRSSDQGGQRPLNPGDRFSPPPAPEKYLPEQITPALLAALATVGSTKAPDRLLVDGVMGMSPLLAAEICHRAGVRATAARALTAQDRTALAKVISALAVAASSGLSRPALTADILYWQPLARLSREYTPFPSLYQAIAQCAVTHRHQQRLANIRNRLLAAAIGAENRLRRTLAKQREERERASNYQLYREIGDTLLASSHLVERGAMQITLDNVHSGHPVSIALNPRLSPAQNAQVYYKKYSRFKNALAKIDKHIAANNALLDYIHSLLWSIEHAADLQTLEEIREEMEQQRLLPRPGNKRPRCQEDGDNFAVYVAPGGERVLAGRSNRQNELLTLRRADKEHYWLHARHFPGSHVILCTDQPDQQALEFAAAVAAWHSKGRSAPKVEVVYTQVKNVRKIPGSRPGLVRYQNYHSLLIAPRLHLGQGDAKD